MEKVPYISLYYKNDKIDTEEYIEKHHLEEGLKQRIIQLEEEFYNEELLSTNEEIQSVNDELQKIYNAEVMEWAPKYRARALR